MNYRDAIDPNFGQYRFKNEMFVTPFWKPEFCEYLIEQAKQNKDKFEDIADVDQMVHYLNFTSFDRSLFEQVQDHFLTDVRAMFDKEWFIPSSELTKIYSPYILWYQIGKFASYAKHTDRMHISGNIKLNDDYEGCDIVFPRQHFSTEYVPVGHAVFWPSGLTHPHFVENLTAGEKFSATIFVPPPPRSPTESVWGLR
jgi:hypothetical protein